MKKGFVALVLSAVLVLSSCAGGGQVDSSSVSSTPSSQAVSSVASSSPESATLPSSDIAMPSLQSTPQETRNERKADFTNGPGGTNRATLSNGDFFLGFILSKIQCSGQWTIQARFEGMVTLKGRLTYEDNEELYNHVWFAVAEEDQDLLPYWAEDDREVRFTFVDQNNNYVLRRIQDLVGQESFDLECEITISHYNIIRMEAPAWNTARLVSITM